MPESGLSGQYGLIPNNIFKSKYEVTNISENPEQTDDYRRRILRDTAPDATFYESDHQREDNHSGEFLSMRYSGHRTDERPDAPDLFLELTDRDPRGTSTLPPVRQMAEQSWERRDHYRFQDDGDNTVAEREKRPQTLISQRIGMFDAIKDRLKIFSTSRDSGGSSSRQYAEGVDSRVQADTDESSITSRGEHIVDNGYTTWLSNTTRLGWNQTGDHEFQVAQYGPSNRNSGAPGDTTRVRSGGQDTSADMTSSAFAAARVASTMRDVAKSQSARGQSRDVSRFADIGDGARRVALAFERKAIDAQLSRSTYVSGDQRNSRTHSDLLPAARTTRVDTHGNQANATQQMYIREMMEAAVRQIGNKRAVVNIQDTVMATKMEEHFDGAPLRTVRMRAPVDDDPRRGADNMNETARRTESMQVARLGRSRMTDTGDMLAKQIVGEGYKTQSHGARHVTVKAPEMRDSHAAGESQQHFAPDAVYDRTVKGIGSKYTRESMDTERTLNAMADV